MPNDKSTELLNDATDNTGSSCCGASCYDPAGDGSTAICKGCGEHCDIITEDND